MAARLERGVRKAQTACRLFAQAHSMSAPVSFSSCASELMHFLHLPLLLEQNKSNQVSSHSG